MKDDKRFIKTTSLSKPSVPTPQANDVRKRHISTLRMWLAWELPSASRSELAATAMFAKLAPPTRNGMSGHQQKGVTVRSRGYLRQG